MASALVQDLDDFWAWCRDETAAERMTEEKCAEIMAAIDTISNALEELDY
jgi:hypothetical protein